MLVSQIGKLKWCVSTNESCTALTLTCTSGFLLRHRSNLKLELLQILCLVLSYNSYFGSHLFVYIIHFFLKLVYHFSQCIKGLSHAKGWKSSPAIIYAMINELDFSPLQSWYLFLMYWHFLYNSCSIWNGSSFFEAVTI